MLGLVLAALLLLQIAGPRSLPGDHPGSPPEVASAPSTSAPVSLDGPAFPPPEPMAPIPEGPDASATAAAAPAQAAVPGGAPRDLLESVDGRLRVRVGWYTDCSGRAPVPREIAAIDSCFPGRTYFIGHNPGVFAPLMSMEVGDRLAYHDSNGRVQRYRIVGIHVMTRNSGTLTLSPGVVAQFQACEVADGSVDRVLDAVLDRS